MQPAFHWSDGTIALLANWGPICYLIAVFPSSWLLDIKGLRASMLVGATLVFAGSAIRCITMKCAGGRVVPWCRRGARPLTK